MICNFKKYFSPFCFLLIAFHCIFSLSCKIIPYYFYYYCILIMIVLTVGIFFSFVAASLLSILMPLFLPSSSVSLSYVILAVPMR